MYTIKNKFSKVILTALFVSFAFLAKAQNIFAPQGRMGAYIGPSLSPGVGIGTNSPFGQLNVYNPGGATTFVIGSPSLGSGGFNSLVLGTSSDQNGFGSIQSIGNSGTAYGNLLLNPTAGNVSIGCGSSPYAKLGVNGNSLIYDPNTNTDGFLEMSYKDQLYNQTTPGQGSGTAYFTMGRWGGSFYWNRKGNAGNVDMMRLDNWYGGNVSTLRVKGEIRSQSMFVVADAWADYVFADDFKLRPLTEVASFIGKNKHLPDVPSEKEIIQNGLNLGEMQKVHMQKIEELTLYIIQIDKEKEEMKARLTALEKLLNQNKK